MIGILVAYKGGCEITGMRVVVVYIIYIKLAHLINLVTFLFPNYRVFCVSALLNNALVEYRVKDGTDG